jgi:hypothetical protein
MWTNIAALGRLWRSLILYWKSAVQFLLKIKNNSRTSWLNRFWAYITHWIGSVTEEIAVFSSMSILVRIICWKYYQSINLSTRIYLPIYLSIYLLLSTCLSIYLSIYVSIYSYLPACLPTYSYLSACLPISLSLYLSVHLSFYLLLSFGAQGIGKTLRFTSVS